jgi:flagellin-like protein
MRERGVSSVIGVVLAVAIVVALAGVFSALAFSFGDSVQSTAPQVDVSYSLIDDGGERTIAVTHESGESVAIDQLYVTASTPVDIGGAPGSSTPANEAYASEREAFAESSGGNPPQVGVDDTWDAGETVYLDPTGAVTDVTINIYWNTQPVQDVNPGNVEGADSYKIYEFTV